MSQSSNNNLRFSIDETIWLKEGQEADEILSLALEPDITIEETTNHVNIKGGLRLTGEYKPVETEGESDASPVDEHLSFRTIDEISLSDEGIANIDHLFPVDITIPSNRINELEDVYVMVETFDYDVPEKGCIQLFADISITGLVDQQKETTAPAYEFEETVVEEEDVYTLPFHRQQEEGSPFQNFEAESYREPQQVEEELTPEVDLKRRGEESSVEENKTGDVLQSFIENVSESDKATPVPSGNRNEGIEEVLEEVEEQVESPELELEVEEEEEVEIVDEEEGTVVEVETEKEYEVELEEDGLEIEEEEETGIVVKEKGIKNSHDNENTLYLTKMLSNGEEQFSRMRMVIVQQGESLDKISERYRIPVTSLLRTNRLNADTIEEGQVLYIPASATKQS